MAEQTFEQVSLAWRIAAMQDRRRASIANARETEHDAKINWLLADDAKNTLDSLSIEIDTQLDSIASSLADTSKSPTNNNRESLALCVAQLETLRDDIAKDAANLLETLTDLADQLRADYDKAQSAYLLTL